MGEQLLDQLTLRRCNFTSAYVEMPIEITNGTVVKLQRLEGDVLARRNRGIELIPALVAPDRGKVGSLGILVTMRDLYEGYAIYDPKERQQLVGGMSPRQFVNQSSITPRGLAEDEEAGFRGGYTFTFEDPIEAFTDTLQELSLRYAVEKIDSTPTRLKEMDHFFSTDYLGGGPNNDEPDSRPAMEVALRKMETRASPTQRVLAQRARPVAVYKANMVYAVIAVGISFTATLLTTLLFAGWRRLGRRFSASPLEIAKAFDARCCGRLGATRPARTSPSTTATSRSGTGRSWWRSTQLWRQRQRRTSQRRSQRRLRLSMPTAPRVRVSTLATGKQRPSIRMWMPRMASVTRSMATTGTPLGRIRRVSSGGL